MRVQSHPAYTDMTPTADFLSLPDMSEALRVGTNDGANPFEVVDLVHCFSSSLEEYHALYPYAQMMTGSPNYAFFAPKMAGQALDGISTGMTAQQMAETMIEQYDRILKAHDDPDTPQDDHPHLLVAVQSDQIAL